MTINYSLKKRTDHANLQIAYRIYIMMSEYTITGNGKLGTLTAFSH